MRKFAVLLLAFVLVFAVFPPVALASGSGTISAGGTYALSDYGNGSTITINTTDPVTINGDSDTAYTNMQIVGGTAGVNLTINNVHIDDSAVSTACALAFTGAGNTLTLAGTNSLASGNYEAGISVISGTELTVSGSGSVTVLGGFGGAGIGGGVAGSGGTIAITGGTVNAIGGQSGAGIGGGGSGSGGTIDITGGVVNATSGSGAAGIGSGFRGSASTITIDHAVVTATGSGGGAGIGSANVMTDCYNAGTILINSSTVTATGVGAAAGIGGGAFCSGGSVTVSQDDANAPCVVYASGDRESDANDIGDGYGGSGVSLTLKDNAMVFLRHDSCVTPMVSGSQTHSSGLTATDGAYNGVQLPSGWDSGFGGWLGAAPVMVKLTIDANGGVGLTYTQDVVKNMGFAVPGRGGYKDGAMVLTSWNTKADGSGTSYAPGATVSLSQDTTLYAIREIVHVTKVQMSSASLSFTVGVTAPAQLTATVVPDYASYPDITWASSDTSVATVDNTGLVTALKAGSADITATADGVAGTCAVTVTQPATGVSLDRTGVVLAAGAQDTLTATVLPSDATDKTVVWSSDNPAVADVDVNGKVTAKAVGRALLTATTDDGGFTASCEVFVSNALLNLHMAVGGTTALSVTEGSGSAAWRSSDAAVASVDSSGVVTAHKAGSAVVTLTVGFMSQSVGILVSEPVTVSAPTQVKAASASFSSVSLNWGAMSGVAQYEIWRAPSKKGTYKLVGTANQNSYTDAGLNAGSTYYYKVRAVYLCSVSLTGGFSAIVSAKPIPAVPASPQAVAASAASVTVSWAAVPGASGYEVWRGKSAKGSFSRVGTTLSAAFLNTGLTAGKTYYYKVRAYCVVNGKKIYGGYSVIVSVKP